jgi:hypothetical protein
MWIIHRDRLGGPEAYLTATSSAWWTVFGTVSIITADIMGNALWMYRCYVLVSNRWLTVLPAILFFASSVFAIVATAESAMPHASLFTGLSQTMGVTWVSLSVAFNVMVTSLICGRLFISYMELKRMGLASGARERWSVLAILAESSLPFSVFGIIFASVYGLPTTNPNSQLVSAMADTWVGIVGISPQLIILRVSMGNAWTSKCVTSEAIQPTSAIQLKSGNFASMTQGSSTTKVTITKEEFYDFRTRDDNDFLVLSV